MSAEIKGLSELPGLELLDTAGWEEAVNHYSGDEASARAVQLAEVWGRLMQAEIAEGQSLRSIAESTFYMAAGGEQISGSMKYIAEVMLINYWKHGMELKRFTERGTFPSAARALDTASARVARIVNGAIGSR